MMGVMRKCRERDIVALPVFDCVVVKASAENEVREIMEAEFKAMTGLNVEVRRELLSVTSNLPPGAPRVPYRRQ